MLENLGMVKKMVKVLLPTLTEPLILVFSKTAKSMGKELLHAGITAHNILVNLETEKTWNGKYSYPDGATYVGQYQNGLLHGQGKLTLPDGSVKKGLFKNDKFVSK